MTARRLLRVVSIAAPPFLLALFCFYIFNLSGQAHPPDAQMMANFQRHRQDFEHLRQMVLEDKGLSRVDDNWTDPSNPQDLGIHPERIVQYRNLFQQLDIHRGFSAYPGKSEIEFIASAQGMVTGGSNKSYVWRQNRPVPLLGSLDELPSEKNSFGYRHIEGNWYLYFCAD